MEQYQTPQSQVDQAGIEEYSEPRVFGVRGRIGRWRFIAYSFTALIIFMIVAALVGAVGAQAPAVSVVGMVIAYIAFFVYSVMISIQRSHDIDLSGWFAIIVLLFGFIFWFIPGTKGANRFGNEPKPNHAGIYIAALLFPIAYVGIIFAIAIPAYQGYIERAQQSQMEQQR